MPLYFIQELAHPQEHVVNLRKFCQGGFGLSAVRLSVGLTVSQRLPALHQLFMQNIDLASQPHNFLLVIMDDLQR